VRRRAKVAILLAGLWLLSPIDLLPEFLPVIGPLDDVLVVALALRYAARRVPRQCCWRPGQPARGCWSACSARRPPLPGPTEPPGQGGGEVWVEGDNEFVADDSRAFGPAVVVGRVVARLWPRPGRLPPRPRT
jgi:hypothetical protein